MTIYISEDIQRRIIPLGSNVIVGDDIKGLIAGIAIYIGGNISYHVVYWKERERIEIWISEYEMETHIQRHNLKVGFIDPREGKRNSHVDSRG